MATAERFKRAPPKRKVIHLPTPLPHQVPVLRYQARFKVIVAGRRWGKTVLGLICVVAGHGSGNRRFLGAAHGKQIWWVAPTYGIASLIWRELKNSLHGAWQDKREDERWILLPGGGSITVKSADNPDSLRGAGLDGVVLDECAFMEESVWNEALRPALADKQGWAIFISTPKIDDEKKGIEWFRRMFIKSESREDWHRWQRPTSDNPKISAKELDELRESMSDLAFRQEIMAEFVDTSEALFKPEWFRYYDADNENYYLKTEQGILTVDRKVCTRFITVDLAAKQQETSDYSVVATWALTPNRNLILLDIMRGKYTESVNKEHIWEAYNKWHVSFIGIESVAYQFAFIQEMQLQKSIITREDGSMVQIPPLPIRELKTKNVNKFARALTISMHYKNGKVFHPNRDTIAAPWLKVYEDELTVFPSRLHHDDQVDAATWAGNELSKPYYTMSEIPILIASGGSR